MTLSLLLEINFSDMVKRGKALVTIFEQKGIFSSPAPLVCIKRKPLCISIIRLQKVCIFLKSLKFVINFIIQRCLRLTGIQQGQPSPCSVPCQNFATAPLQVPLSLGLVTAGAAHCCLWALALPMAYLGMGISPQLFLWLQGSCKQENNYKRSSLSARMQNWVEL